MLRTVIFLIITVALVWFMFHTKPLPVPPPREIPKLTPVSPKIQVSPNSPPKTSQKNPDPPNTILAERIKPKAEEIYFCEVPDIVKCEICNGPPVNRCFDAALTVTQSIFSNFLILNRHKLKNPELIEEVLNLLNQKSNKSLIEADELSQIFSEEQALRLSEIYKLIGPEVNLLNQELEKDPETFKYSLKGISKNFQRPTSCFSYKYKCIPGTEKEISSTEAKFFKNKGWIQ